MGLLTDFLQPSTSRHSAGPSYTSDPRPEASLYSNDEDSPDKDKQDEEDDKSDLDAELGSVPLIPANLSDPVGVFPAYLNQGGPVTLAVRADSAWSKKNWTIGDAKRDEVLFRARGKDATMRVEKVFTDGQGREICVLRRHHAMLQGDYYVESMDGLQIIKFTKHRRILTVSFNDQTTGQPREIRLVANWRKCRGILSLNGKDFAFIEKAPGTSMLAMNSTYHVIVPRGMDLALMAVISVVYVVLAKEYNEGMMAAINA